VLIRVGQPFLLSPRLGATVGRPEVGPAAAFEQGSQDYSR
jgi:hypothetical protein